MQQIIISCESQTQHCDILSKIVVSLGCDSVHGLIFLDRKKMSAPCADDRDYTQSEHIQAQHTLC